MEVMLNKTPKHMERGYDLAGKALTPKSERPRKTWGSLVMSLQMLPERCQKGRKCIGKDRHAHPCWPGD